jgi:hypothetical protein
MGQRQNQDIAWSVAHVHDEEEAFAPVGMKVHSVGKWLGDLMCETFVESSKSCHCFLLMK